LCTRYPVFRGEGIRLRIARKACHHRRHQPPLLIPISTRRHQNLHHEASLAKNVEHRRRGGDEPLAQLVDLTETSKRRKVTTQNRYNKEYAANNLRYAKQVVEWLVLVGKISNLKSGLSIQPHHNGWWFDWQKVNELADDVCDYCSSKSMPSGEPSMRGVLKEEITKVAADLGLQGGAQLAQTKKLETMVTNMNIQVTRLTDVINQMHRNQAATTNECDLDESHAYEHPDGTVREIPPDFELTNETVYTGWRFWTVGNRHAGKGRRPVRPYCKLTFRDFKGSPWRKMSKNMSKWRKLFEWITQQLTDSDSISHRWQVDGPTHFRTFNRIRKLLPGAQGSYNVDPGRRSVVTTYGILVMKLKEEREAAAAAAAAATG